MASSIIININVLMPGLSAWYNFKSYHFCTTLKNVEPCVVMFTSLDFKTSTPPDFYLGLCINTWKKFNNICTFCCPLNFGVHPNPYPPTKSLSRVSYSLVLTKYVDTIYQRPSPSYCSMKKWDPSEEIKSYPSAFLHEVTALRNWTITFLWLQSHDIYHCSKQWPHKDACNQTTK
jgi:hypothetical protein